MGPGVIVFSFLLTSSSLLSFPFRTMSSHGEGVVEELLNIVLEIMTLLVQVSESMPASQVPISSRQRTNVQLFPRSVHLSKQEIYQPLQIKSTEACPPCHSSPLMPLLSPESVQHKHVALPQLQSSSNQLLL
ncbi:hypothetical protein SEVIR_9G443550v4 [Setaria viridis]